VPGQAGDYVVISVDPTVATRSLNLSRLFKAIDYVRLETPVDHLVGDISRIIANGDRFYILDARVAQSVFCFKRDGTFLFEINCQGRGPGEYGELLAMAIDSEKSRLLLHCGNPGKVIIFDLDGNYLSEEPLNFIASDIAVAGKERLAFFCDYASNPSLAREGTFPNLVLVEAGNHAVRETSLRFPGSRNVQALGSTANNFSPLPGGEASLLVPYNDTLYHVTATGATPVYLFDFGKWKKGDTFYSMLEKEGTDWEDVQGYLLNSGACTILQAIESEHHLYFAYQHGQAFHIAFHDKRDGTLHDAGRALEPGADMNMLLNDIDGAMIQVIYGVDGASFLSVLQPVEMLRQKGAAPAGSNLASVLDALDEQDNPVIAVLVPR
jgi:hypothetical protein